MRALVRIDPDRHHIHHVPSLEIAEADGWRTFLSRGGCHAPIRSRQPPLTATSDISAEGQQATKRDSGSARRRQGTIHHTPAQSKQTHPQHHTEKHLRQPRRRRSARAVRRATAGSGPIQKGRGGFFPTTESRPYTIAHPRPTRLSSFPDEKGGPDGHRGEPGRGSPVHRGRGLRRDVDVADDVLAPGYVNVTIVGLDSAGVKGCTPR